MSGKVIILHLVLGLSPGDCQRAVSQDIGDSPHEAGSVRGICFVPKLGSPMLDEACRRVEEEGVNLIVTGGNGTRSDQIRH